MVIYYFSLPFVDPSMKFVTRMSHLPGNPGTTTCETKDSFEDESGDDSRPKTCEAFSR